MHPQLKKSAPAKISAIGFIILIIFGNLWLVDALILKATPVWVSYGFFTGVCIVFVGGIGLMYLLLLNKLNPPASQGDQDGI